jgi:hypothetical protein
MKAAGPNRKGQHRYKGELAKPILASVYFTMTVAELDDALQQTIHKARLEKLKLLMAHYEIPDKTDYLSLALTLAIDHVPGFRIGRASELLRLEHGDYGKVLGSKRGRPRELTPELHDSLRSTVERTKRECRLQTDREALRIIARRQPWSRPANHRGDFDQWIKTLQNRLSKSRSPKK